MDSSKISISTSANGVLDVPSFSVASDKRGYAIVF